MNKNVFWIGIIGIVGLFGKVLMDSWNYNHRRIEMNTRRK